MANPEPSYLTWTQDDWTNFVFQYREDQPLDNVSLPRKPALFVETLVTLLPQDIKGVWDHFSGFLKVLSDFECRRKYPEAPADMEPPRLIRGFLIDVMKLTKLIAEDEEFRQLDRARDIIEKITRDGSTFADPATRAARMFSLHLNSNTISNFSGTIIP